MRASTERRLGGLSGFCRLVAAELERLAVDGRILLRGDAFATVARLLAADAGERRLLKRYLDDLTGVGFLAVEGTSLRVGFPDEQGPRPTRRASVDRAPAAPAPSPAAPPPPAEPVSTATATTHEAVPSRAPDEPVPPAAPPPPSPTATDVTPAAGAPVQRALFEEPAAGQAPKAPAKRAAKSKSPEGPLPFKVPEALAALEAAAGSSRFVAGEARDVSPGMVIQIQRRIRAYPTLAEWTTCGEWIAGGGHWKTARGDVLDAGWVASTDFGPSMGKARAWKTAGGAAAAVGAGGAVRPIAPRDPARRGYAQPSPSASFTDDGDGVARTAPRAAGGGV